MSTNISRRRWTATTIEAELRAVQADLGHFPTRSELVARGLRGLWDALPKNGGVELWQERLAQAKPKAAKAAKPKAAKPKAAAAEAPVEEVEPEVAVEEAPVEEAEVEPEAAVEDVAVEAELEASVEAELPVSEAPAPVSPQDIAVRAYELYESGAPGDHTEHWLAAERELSGC